MTKYASRFELKLCPFCGSSAFLQKIPDWEQWRVICSNNECAATVYSRYAEGHGAEKVIEKWNRRVEDHASCADCNSQMPSQRL